MRVRLWGTRGSLPSPGPHTVRYGGNTACVEVSARPGSVVVLDAGTGIRRLGAALAPDVTRVDILLTHLHLDHLQGLAFFPGLYRDGAEIHVWGPASNGSTIGSRLSSYFSPPLFPVRLADLPCPPTLHDVPTTGAAFDIPGVRAEAALVCHPGPTLGYRLTDGSVTLTYLPDHEPALGQVRLPRQAQWTSGFDLAADVDLLIHDSQYSSAEYRRRVGWGHSSIEHALAFAAAANARHLVGFHHDPDHSDEQLDALFAPVRREEFGCPAVTPAREGDVFRLGTRGPTP